MDIIQSYLGYNVSNLIRHHPGFHVDLVNSIWYHPIASNIIPVIMWSWLVGGHWTDGCFTSDVLCTMKIKTKTKKTFSSYTENLTDGCWSPTRPSVFFIARQDGVITFFGQFLPWTSSHISLLGCHQTIFVNQVLDAWDILYQQKAPVLSMKVGIQTILMVLITMIMAIMVITTIVYKKFCQHQYWEFKWNSFKI